MKKLTYLLLTLIMFIPFSVFAFDDYLLPDTIGTSEGVNFIYNGDYTYYAYVNSDVELLTLNYDFGSYSLVQGSNIMVIDGFNTIQKIRVYMAGDNTEMCNPEICSSSVITFNVTKDSPNNADLKLKDLEVAGFDINFSNNTTKYEVTVPNKTESVYVYADYESSVNVIGTGIIDLNEKGDTEIKVRINNTREEKIFTIVVKKKNPYLIFYIIIVLLIAALIGTVIYFINKSKKSIKVGDIKGALNNLDLSKTTIKSEKKEEVPAYEQPITEESLKSGILSPRTMMAPDEDKKENK